MSNEYDWENDDQSTDEGATGQEHDSNAIKALREKAKADAKAKAELQAQVDKLTAVVKEKEVTDILAKKGVNPKAARLVLKDVADVTEETVDAWLQDNAELFNLKVAESTQEESTEGSEEQSSELSRQDAATSQASTPGTGRNLKATLDSFKTFEELEAWAKSQQ